MSIATEQSSTPQPQVKEIVSDSLAVGVTFALALTIIQRGVGFLRGILFCRLMSDQELGQWSMVWSFLMLLAPLAVLGLPGCFGRYVEYYRQRGRLKTFISRVVSISGFTTLFLGLYIILNQEQVSWLIFKETSEVGMSTALAVGISLIFVTALNLLVSLMEAMRQVRLVTIMRFILGVAFALTGTTLLFFFEYATVAVTYGYAISCILASIPAVWFLTRFRGSLSNTGVPIPLLAMCRRIAPFALWLWISNLFSNMFEIMDRYMLIHCSGAEAGIAQGFVGQYHSGRVLPLLLVSVAAVLGGVLMPYMSAAWEANKKKAAKTQLNWTIKTIAIAFTLAGYVLVLFAPLLFEYVLQGRYNDGLAVLPLTIVYCIWFSLMTVGQDYLWVAEKGRLVLAAITLGLIANIGLNWVMIPQFGLWGAVIATSLANLIMLAACYCFNHAYGCRTDLGVWLTLLIPSVLLLPPVAGAAFLIAIIYAAAKTNWLLGSEEKRQLATVLEKVKSKLRGSNAGT